MSSAKYTEIKSVSLSELKIGGFQVWSKMSHEVLTRFIEDVRENGIHELIHVDENYVVLDGHHRYEAANIIELSNVDIKVHFGLSEEEKLEFAHKNNVLTREISREEKIAKAIELRKGGRSYRQIGEWLGVSEKSIRNWCSGFSHEDMSAPEKTEGSDGKQYASTQPSADEKQERRYLVKELREQGVKIADIAEQVGVAVGTVANDIKAIEKVEKQAEKEREERKRVQELDLIEFEAKLLEETAPQIRDDEPITSPDNTVISARRKALDASATIAGSFNSVARTSPSVKETYVQQVKSLVETGLITLGQYAENDREKEIVYMCLQMIKNLKQLGEDEE